MTGCEMLLRAVTCVALLCSTALPAVASEPDFAVPPYAGVYHPQNRDEQGLWAVADEDERALRDQDVLIRDPALNDYVSGVLCRTVGEDRCGNVRLYIVRVPAFNASMAPNGTMRVYSGLLLRIRSEAELASVLSHEFAHFEMRHSLSGYRDRRTGGDIMAWASVLGAMATRYGGGYSNTRDIQRAVLGDMFRYGRDQEREADMLGFGYLASSGYRPAAAADVWRAVMNESDRTAADRGRRSARYEGVAFFASHPTSLERADTLSVLANRVPGGDVEGRESYGRAIAPFISTFLGDELAKNDFGGTDYLIERLGAETPSADLLFARGELYRGRGHPRDMVNAVQFYRSALQHDEGYAEAYRGLGLTLMRTGDAPGAGEALSHYLRLAPEAPDAAMLQSMIED